MNFHKLILTSIIVLLSIEVKSQNQFQRKRISETFSSKNSSPNEINQYYFSLDSLNSSSWEYHLRFEKSGQIVDLYSQDGIEFKGQILNHIQEEIIGEKKGDNRDSTSYNYLYLIEEIQDDLASKTGQLLINENTYTIPTDSLIENWNFDSLHCTSLQFDYKIKTKYYSKAYACLKNQKDSVDFVIDIKNIESKLITTLKIGESHRNFLDSLPKGKYYLIDGWISMYTMTNEEKQFWKMDKPRRDYLKSIKDSLDNFIEIELNKQEKIIKDIDCFEDYRLIFNEKGKLVKVKVAQYYKPKLSDGFAYYIEDSREIRKCKKIIKKVFREINLSSFNLKYKVNRTLSFDLNGEIDLRDDTVY